MSSREPPASALEAALRFLRARDRFVDELHAHLVAKGFHNEEVDRTVRYLIERNLLDDARTSQSFVERRSGKRAIGVDRMREEMQRLGASRETIDNALAGHARSESERALAALRSKFEASVDLTKAGRFLYSRGFSEDAIEAALDQFCQANSYE